MDKPYQQQVKGMMKYPSRGTANRLIFKTPFYLWRMGLKGFLGSRMMVLTTTGRINKKPRYTMLSYGRYAGSYYLLSGWGDWSDWYKNIQADPLVTIQTDTITSAARARRVESLGEYRPVMQAMLEGGGDSHFEPWLESLDIQESIDDLVAKRERVYLVALDPCDGSGPIPLEADLKWVWGALILLLGVGSLIALMKRKNE